MFWYEILNNPTFNVDKKIIDNIFKKISLLVQKKQKWTLNIVFVEAKKIKELNKNYRNIDKVTDVLSFHYYEDFSNLKSKEIAWELVFCEEKIMLQAREYWLWEEKEFYKLLIHSILHILWYDHEKDEDYEIMQNLENIIWKEIFEKN
jgi:probable rRNA maturation factor